MSQPWYQRVHLPQGFPTPSVDTAPTAVFLVMFFLCAIANIVIFRRNSSRNHKFLISAPLIGFNMARTVSCALRLSWTYYPHDRNIAIASTIFNAAGVLLLYIVNLIFAQRVFRGLHPKLGWNKPLSLALKVMYGLIPALLVMTITVVVQSFFATDPSILRLDHSIQLAPVTFFAIVCILPIPIVVFALISSNSSDVDHFGKGHLHLKAAVVIASAVLLSLGQWFRMIVAYVGKDPTAWYNQKWAFYFFQFTVEIVTVLLFLGVRVDLVFHVPNGSRGPHSYTQTKLSSQLEREKSETGSSCRSSDGAVEKA